MLERSLVLWFPDWSVLALSRADGGAAADDPVAVVADNIVVVCSHAARRAGVRRGQRRRDAQARCPGLRVIAEDPDRDHREFAPLVAQIEEFAPGVQILRAGLCVLRVRGPARYYGGEVAAACAILDALAELGMEHARAGVADGVFAAELAARTGTAEDDPVCVITEGGSAGFLAPLPATFLGDDELASLLARLGVHTLGDVAALPAERVRERFGPRGERWHALATGEDARMVQPRTPPVELGREIGFEPPLEVADQVAFAVRTTAEAFVRAVDAEGMVCTELRVVLIGDRGERSDRVWLHPAAFDAAAIVDRVRWQLAEEQGDDLRSGVTSVRIEPAATDAAAHHRPGIFGAGPQERVHHTLSRVQAMLGHRGVLTPLVAGGRWLGERQTLVPWGDRAVAKDARDRPWPGSLVAPHPATVFPRPRPLAVEAADGDAIRVDARGGVSAPPAILADGGARRPIAAWAGPWPVVERMWDDTRRRAAHRFQVIDAEQTAWLLIWEGGSWTAEARYD